MDKPKLCDYCHEQPARYYFATAEKWCCEDYYLKCPYYRNKLKVRMQEKYYYAKINVYKREIEQGLHKCIYCGETANYLLGTDRPCCKSTARECPNFYNFLSEVHKKKYIDKPYLLESMKNVSKEVHNRPEVKESKSECMLELHRGNCRKCKEFQENYSESLTKRLENNKEKTKKRQIAELKTYGIEFEEGEYDKDVASKLILRARYYKKKGGN